MHLRFCEAMYREQMRNGRYFTHEHPKMAESWNLDFMIALRDTPGVLAAEADLRQFGLKSKKNGVEGPAKKPTRFMTNSLEMYNTLNIKCKGDHEHINLMEGRASAAAIYPRGLCRAIVKGTIRQARVDRGNLATMKCDDSHTEVFAI